MCIRDSLLTACEPFGPIESVIIGEDADFNPETPLLVYPTALAFEDVAVLALSEGAWPEQPVTVTNLSDEEVPVYGYAEMVGDQVFSVDADPYTTLGPGESVDLPVIFQPQTAAVYSASFSIVGGTAPVSLSGQGRAPIIDVETWEPAAVSVGCTAVFEATVTNLSLIHI